MITLKKIYWQWNPDFSILPDSSTQKSFALDVLWYDTAILPPIFSNSWFFKLLIVWTNSWLPFKTLHSISWTLKILEPTKTGFSPMHSCMQSTCCGESVAMHFLLHNSWQICHFMLFLHKKGSRITWSKLLCLVEKKQELMTRCFSWVVYCKCFSFFHCGLVIK